MKKSVITSRMLIFLMLCNVCKAQNFSTFKDSIRKEILQKHLEILCDEQKGGRKFATQGEKNAAYYIREQFIKSGLANRSDEIENYFQNYVLNYDTLINFNIQNKNNTLSYVSDFLTWHFCFLPDTSIEELIYAGFGLDGENYSDYKNIDVKNKWAVVEFNSPIDSSGNLMDYFDFNKPHDKSQINQKKEIAQKNGARGIIFKINSDDYPAYRATDISIWKYYRSKDKLAENLMYGTFPAIFARHSAIDSLMGINTKKFNEQTNSILKKGLSVSGRGKATVSFKIDKQRRPFYSQNVIGILEGKKKIIGTIVSAHYDAVKLNDTLFYPGANDNASGTSAVIQLADVYSKIVKSGYIPKKSIAFIAFSGEEEGLVGSNYFIKHKPFLMDSTTININLDAIGVMDSERFEKRGLYISAPESVLNKIQEEFTQIASQETPPISLEFNQYYQYSDNACFIYDGYPAMHLLSGWGPMHTPQDSPEIIDYNNFESVTRFVFDIILTYNHFETEINK